MKKSTLFLAIAVALSVTACGESTEEKQARLLKDQQAQIAQLQQNQMQQAQMQQAQMQQPQQYAQQPQIIQQPAAPVVVQAPHQDNTLTNLATGALIGHALSGGFNGSSNNAPADRIIEHKTVIVNNHAAPMAAPVAPTPVAPVTTAPAPVAPRASGMDMNKLSQSSSYAPRQNVAPKASSSMNMSRLSSKR